MEQTNNAKARYIPTRVAVCKRCEGKRRCIRVQR